MSSNRLKLNTGKTQFTCLGTRYQLAKIDASVLVANGSAVDLLCTVTCLGKSGRTQPYRTYLLTLLTLSVNLIKMYLFKRNAVIVLWRQS